MTTSSLTELEAELSEAVKVASAAEAERKRLQALVYAAKRHARIQRLLDEEDLDGITVYRSGVVLSYD